MLSYNSKSLLILERGTSRQRSQPALWVWVCVSSSSVLTVRQPAWHQGSSMGARMWLQVKLIPVGRGTPSSLTWCVSPKCWPLVRALSSGHYITWLASLRDDAWCFLETEQWRQKVCLCEGQTDTVKSQASGQQGPRQGDGSVAASWLGRAVEWGCHRHTICSLCIPGDSTPKAPH